MIVSASRRCDIPAHYAQWFINRVRHGWCTVPNPFNARQRAHVPLTPQDVDAFVFWTRDPRPIMPWLGELEALGHRFIFQFTLVEYPGALHPGMPALEERIAAFKELAQAIGPERVLWRYDPIMFSQQTDPDFHWSTFTHLARALSGHTRRVTVSLMEPYRKALSRLCKAHTWLAAPSGEKLRTLFADMAALAGSLGMEPVSCADESGLSSLGFAPGACVDGALLNSLFGLGVPHGKDARQRPACLCVPSKDIGAYGICPAGCAYCYATRSFDAARNALAAHDPHAASLMPGSTRHE